MIYKVTTDTSVLIKGLIPPRRKNNDSILFDSIQIHKKAASILQKIESGEYKNHIPLIALIETACVVSRLTNDPSSASLAVSFVGNNAKMYDTAILLEKSIDVGIKTKASGFDVLFIACAEMTNSTLMTDDKKMFEKACEIGVDAIFLRQYSEL